MKYLVLLFVMISLSSKAFAQASVIAIWPIEFSAVMSLSNHDKQVEIEQLVPALIADELISAGIEVVEREKLLEIISEQNLGSSELVDESSRIALGRIIGAKLMLFGNFIEVGPSWQLAHRVVDTETGKVMFSLTQDQSDGQLLDVASDLGRILAKQLSTK